MGGLFFSQGPYMRWRGKGNGIRLKIHLNTPSGLSAMREVCLPQNTNERIEWQPPKSDLFAVCGWNSQDYANYRLGFRTVRYAE